MGIWKGWACFLPPDREEQGLIRASMRCGLTCIKWLRRKDSSLVSNHKRSPLYMYMYMSVPDPEQLVLRRNPGWKCKNSSHAQTLQNLLREGKFSLIPPAFLCLQQLPTFPPGRTKRFTVGQSKSQSKPWLRGSGTSIKPEMKKSQRRRRQLPGKSHRLLRYRALGCIYDCVIINIAYISSLLYLFSTRQPMIQAMATAPSPLISHTWLSPETCRYICNIGPC